MSTKTAFTPQLLTQKQLINKINKHTAFTYRFVDILSRQIDQMDNKYRKDKEDAKLAEILIKSTSDYYINRAIKVLKNERAKGREDECLKILTEIFTKK